MHKKKLNTFLLSFLFLCFSCQDLKMWFGNRPRLVEPQKLIQENWSLIHYKYDSDFPPKEKVENNKFGTALIEERFIEGGVRYGKTGKSDSKEGKWLSGTAGFDENDNVYAKGDIWREEYFKNGLRDSVFRQFDKDGKIIFETTFKMGTGFWKEFHKNGKVYFEINTKDGYFTDTLKLYNDKGRFQEKLFYKKDSLFYSKNFDVDVVDTLVNGKKVRITYKTSMKDDYYIYQKEYSNKIERYDSKKNRIYYKTDTLINNFKKQFTLTIKEDKVGEKTEESLYTYTNKPNEKLFDYYKLYRKGRLLKYRYLKKIIGKESAKYITVEYDENSEKINESIYDTKNYTGKFPYVSNRNNHFEKGKKTYFSEEIVEKITIDELQSIQITESQILYYDLKGNIFKKEFIKYRQGEYKESCSQGSTPFEVDEMIILKTEFYKNNKLIKTNN